MRWSEKKDDELLSLVAKGGNEGREAFAIFFDRHKEYLFGICYGLASRYQFGFFSAEDIFQSTMKKVFESAGLFKAVDMVNPSESEHKADAWLGEIARNVTFDLFRRKPMCMPLDPDLLDDYEKALEIPEISNCEDSEEVRLIREAIDTLSPIEQTVIWAASQFYRRGKFQRTPTEDLDEIIKALGISRENFRKIKERAKKKIRIFIAAKKPIPRQNEIQRQIRIE